MDNKKIVLIAAKACDNKKAKDIRLININKVCLLYTSDAADDP